MIHPTDQLPAYAAASLPADLTGQIRSHLDGCDECRTQLASWQRVSSAVRERVDAVAAPPPALFDAVRRRLPPPAVARYAASLASAPFRRAIGVLAYQWRLVRWPVWAVAAFVLAGTALATLPSAGADRVLATVVPLGAAAAIAGACGRGVDPASELTAATITSARVVLLARLTLVLAIATLNGLVVTAVAVIAAPAGLAGALALTMAWLVPLAALSAVTFALSVLVRPAAGITAAVTAWFLGAVGIAGNATEWLAGLSHPLWTHAPAVFVVAVIVIAVTIFLAPRREPFRVAT